MKISVCIPSVRSSTLSHAIRSIQQQSYANWDLTIISQGDDKTVRETCVDFEKDDIRIHHVHSDVRGVSAARNAGIENSSGEIIAFIDDDCEAHPEWLENIARGFNEQARAGFIAGSLVAPVCQKRGLSLCPQVSPPEVFYDPKNGTPPPAGFDWLGANFAVRRVVLEKVGSFDPCLGAGTEFAGADDSDFRIRLFDAGIPTKLIPYAIVKHTYGTRYGWRTVLNHTRNYAWGQGGMAGKFTLLNSPRGEQWLQMARNDAFAYLRRGNLPRFPFGMRRFLHMQKAYHHCLLHYEIDPSSQLLRKKIVSV